MKKDGRLLASLTLNIILIILAAIGGVMSVRRHGCVPASLVYYTQDSNLFLGIAALTKTAYEVRSVLTGKNCVPDWVQKMKYMSICCIAVTLSVVLFILAPMAGPLGGLRRIMLTDSMLFQHFLSPVLGIIGFLLVEKRTDLSFHMTLIALIPTLLYAAVLYPLNIAGIVDGPYPFLQVRNLGIGKSVMWFFIVLGLSYLLALLVWSLNKGMAHLAERHRK